MGCFLLSVFWIQNEIPSVLFNIIGLGFQRKKMKNQWHMQPNTILEQQDSGKGSDWP